MAPAVITTPSHEPVAGSTMDRPLLITDGSEEDPVVIADEGSDDDVVIID
jgi:hypothetical protein